MGCKNPSLTMGFIHIIALFEFSLILFTLYFIIRIHRKTTQIGAQDDFISDFSKKKSREIEKKNVKLSVDTYFKMMMIVPIEIGIAVYFGTANALTAVIAALFGLLVPEAVVSYIKYDMDRKFELRYARSLEQLGASLSAGLSIQQAVEDVAECKFVHESMRAKYGKLSADLRMGLQVSEAFQRFAEGTGSQDAEDVALAIDVQNTVGGHEAEVIQSIAKDIRSRIMLRREVKSIFSPTSPMIWMMDFIAPGIILWFLFANKNYVEVYFSSPIYLAIFIFFIVMIIIGILINHGTLKKIKKGA